MNRTPPPRPGPAERAAPAAAGFAPASAGSDPDEREAAGQSTDSWQSPSIQRMILILNFFLEHPRQDFTLTQIARYLHVSRATAHTILLGLADSGYLTRHPDKTYALGQRLTRLATDALSRFPTVALAEQEIGMLAADLDLVATVVFRDGDAMVVRESAGSARKLDRAKKALGRSFSHDPGAMDDLEKERGFSAMAACPGASGKGAGSSARVLREIESDATYDLTQMIAPVLIGGEAAFAIMLTEFEPGLRGSDVLSIGGRLRESCLKITRLASGENLDG